MHQVSCPGCGAPVKFASTASVMAVCGFCRSTVVKVGEAVRDTGKMSALLEDFTPMQLGATGLHGGVRFTAVGRVQLRYSAGLWNEWYLRFDDGADGWLSDAGGLITVARKRTPQNPQLPAFEQMTVGAAPQIGGQPFTVAERRVAQLVGGEGELPFVVGQGWEARVVDLRRGADFVTLDYSFPPKVQVFLGRGYLDWSGVRAQGLRRPYEIKDAAGRFKGKSAQLACPSCGSALSFPVGQVLQLFCKACHAQIDVSGEKAEILAKHREMEALPSALKLGDRGTIKGFEYEVIGLQQRVGAVEGEDFGWTEYLLFCPEKPLLYLSETAEGWETTRLLNHWPDASTGSANFNFDGKRYVRQWEYTARTTYAAGSFDWNVRTGDLVRIVEYHDDSGHNKLFAEQTADELEWSRATAVSAADLRQWFGKKVSEPAGAALASAFSGKALRPWAWGAVLMLLLFNLETLEAGPINVFVMAAAAALVWLPIWLAEAGKDKSGGDASESATGAGQENE
jgi:hypothetical protein